MKILAISDIHNDIDNLMNYIDKISMIDFDVIVAIGDFIDINIPKGFSGIDIAQIIFEEFTILKKPFLFIPGNLDKEIIEFFEEKGVSLHGKGIAIGDVGFYGYGGARTPFHTSLEPSEDELESALRKGYEKVKDCKFKVQITHMPPFNTKLDMLYTGAHVGSEIIRKIIEELKPDVAISAHIHEARGVDEIGKTKIINPGRFPEGYCGIITLESENVDVKIINLI